MSELPSKPWFWVLVLAVTAASIYLNCSGQAASWCKQHCAPAGWAYDTAKGTCTCIEVKP